LNFYFKADLDPPFDLDADPDSDPPFQSDADPDPDPLSKMMRIYVDPDLVWRKCTLLSHVSL
jgi:hypothetical protein